MLLAGGLLPIVGSINLAPGSSTTGANWLLSLTTI